MKFKFNYMIALIITVLFLTDMAFAQMAETLSTPQPSNSLQTQPIRKLNPTGALLRSAFVPGWGQYYNGKYIKGTIFAVGESYLIVGIYTYWKDADHYQKNFENSNDLAFKATEFNKFANSRDQRNLRLWIIAASIFYSMFDAYVDAQLSDFNQSDKAYQVYVAPIHGNGVQLAINFKIK